MSSRKLRPLIGAALISTALHAMVLAGASVWMPRRPADVPVLQARLEPLPAPSPAPSVAPPPPEPRAIHRKPRRTHETRIAPHPAAPSPRVLAVPAPEAAASADLAVPDEPPAPDEQAPVETEVAQAPAPAEQVAVAPPSTLPPPEPPAVRALPRRGRISYTLYLGTDRFEIGRTVQTWEFEDGAYKIGSTSETTGLAAVLRSERRTYLSEGTVTGSGLRPQSFLMSRQRRGETEVARARFDWNAAHITWGTTDEKNDAALPPNAQDFLSLMYQLSLAPPAGGRIAVPTTTGTKFETYELDVLPEETIDTPLGPLRALPLRQVRKPNAETIQIWLAADYRYLPVKLRFYGRDGEPTGEQIVNEIRLTEDRPSAGATQVN